MNFLIMHGEIVLWSHLKRHNEVFTVSSWIVFSQSAFYIIMTKKGTIKSADFLECLKSLLFVKNKLNYDHSNNFAILMDNASIHKTKAIN